MLPELIESAVSDHLWPIGSTLAPEEGGDNNAGAVDQPIAALLIG